MSINFCENHSTGQRTFAFSTTLEHNELYYFRLKSHKILPTEYEPLEITLMQLGYIQLSRGATFPFSPNSYDSSVCMESDKILHAI